MDTVVRNVGNVENSKQLLLAPELQTAFYMPSNKV